MGDPGRFGKGKQFRSFTGLVPRASETGESDRKCQPMSKAGSSLLRTTLVRAADTARHQDPQLARIYYLQMTERGKDHLGALCVVAANLAERAWAVMDRAMPYVICDVDGTPVTPEQAKAVIAKRFTVPPTCAPAGAARRRGKAPKNVHAGRSKPDARGGGQRGDLPRKTSSGPGSCDVNYPNTSSERKPLDNRSSIGNQIRAEQLARGHRAEARYPSSTLDTGDVGRLPASYLRYRLLGAGRSRSSRNRPVCGPVRSYCAESPATAVEWYSTQQLSMKRTVVGAPFLKACRMRSAVAGRQAGDAVANTTSSAAIAVARRAT